MMRKFLMLLIGLSIYFVLCLLSKAVRANEPVKAWITAQKKIERNIINQYDSKLSSTQVKALQQAKDRLKPFRKTLFLPVISPKKLKAPAYICLFLFLCLTNY